MQQFKLFPLLATAYAYGFAGQYIQLVYKEVNDELHRGNVDMLPEVGKKGSSSANLTQLCTQVHLSPSESWGVSRLIQPTAYDKELVCYMMS